jgi:hypothetical protein
MFWVSMMIIPRVYTIKHNGADREAGVFLLSMILVLGKRMAFWQGDITGGPE